MLPHDFRAELAHHGLTEAAAGRFLDCDPRNIRRWSNDDGDGPPRSVALTLRLMRRFQVSPADALAMLAAA